MLWQTTPPPSISAMPLRLQAPRTVISTAEDATQAATVVASNARRVLSIYSDDLESPIFEHAPFLEAVKRLVLGRRFAKVRVLIRDATRLPHHRHRFVQLARKLTSHIEIRVAPPPYADDPSAYVIADERATLYRLQHDRWDGICDLDDRAVARLYLDRFDEAWHAIDAPRAQLALRL